MSASETTEAGKTAGFIAVGGLLIAVTAGFLTYLAFHRAVIVAATTLGIGVFVTVWAVFLALAMIAWLFAGAPSE